ncbi:hypothetical protein D3C71_2158810 [compost metagenome]
MLVVLQGGFDSVAVVAIVLAGGEVLRSVRRRADGLAHVLQLALEAVLVDLVIRSAAFAHQRRSGWQLRAQTLEQGQQIGT